MKHSDLSRTFARYWVAIAACLFAQASLSAWRHDYVQAAISYGLSVACVLLARTHRRVAALEAVERDPERWHGKRE